MKTLSNQSFFRLFNVLLIITSLTFITTWLPFLRAILDGESYKWGTGFFGILFHGDGVSNEFYYIIINFVIGLGLLCSFYWIKNRKIFYFLLAIWFGSMIGNSLFQVFYGKGYMFHGDTLGIHLDLSYIIVPLMLFLGTFVTYMIIQDSRNPFKATWSKKNKFWALILLIPIPIQAVLLYFGEPHGTTDQIGVIIAILQIIFLHKALKGYEVEKFDLKKTV